MGWIGAGPRYHAHPIERAWKPLIPQGRMFESVRFS